MNITSNIKFNTLNSDYLSCHSSNININTFLSIGNNNSTELNNNSLDFKQLINYSNEG